MPYTGSKASEAMGSVVSIGPLVTATGTATYVPIAEITSTEFSGAKRTVLNTTNMNSGGFAEKLDSIADYGNIKLTMNRINNDPGQLALAAAFGAGGKYLFEVQEPINAEIGQTTTGDLTKFVAIVSEGPNFSLDPTKVTVLSCTLDISGQPTITPGT